MDGFGGTERSGCLRFTFFSVERSWGQLFVGVGGFGGRD